MNLSDREILELNELCGAVVDGTLTEAQRARLTAMLRESEAARRHYVRALGQSASLHTYAAEMHAEAPDARAPETKLLRTIFSWGGPALATAAAIALGVWFLPRLAPAGEKNDAPPIESVARLTGAKNAQWAVAAFAPGARLAKSQRLELTAGLAEITFDSGARVVLEGPTVLHLDSAWNGTLRRGTLKASVPPEAVGFRISNPAVDVVDLGTEFTMIADGSGAAEVLVLKGEVEAAPRASSEADTILLREKEARRFEASGVSDVSDSEKKFALFAQPLALDYFSASVNYVHWSFDESAGAVAQADVRGTPDRALDVQILDATREARTEGHRARALHFDGSLFAKAQFPGLSGSATRTIAFWVKVPEDAQLSEAFSMVTWGFNSKKLGLRHVGINWNKNPADGPLGALRTDFRGGHAVGTTALRDGRWHHITVVFAPGGDAAPVQVQQYVDGRLESSVVTTDAMHAAASADDRDALAALSDVLWLGCRLSVRGLTTNGRFRGDMDELFVADRALAPREIVALMNDNRLPVAGLAAR